MGKNYYRVLRIPTAASLEEVKAAYRRRAKESHPDRTGEGSGAFREVQEAYDVLSDPSRRAAYDLEVSRHASGRGRPAEPLRRPAWNPWNAPEPFRAAVPRANSFSALQDFFGDLQPLTAGASFAPRFAEFRREVIDIALESDEAAAGGQVRLAIPVLHPCRQCHGRRAIGSDLCPGCGGEGSLLAEEEVTVAFPPGLSSLYEVELALPRQAPLRRLKVRFWVT